MRKFEIFFSDERQKFEGRRLQRSKSKRHRGLQSITFSLPLKPLQRILNWAGWLRPKKWHKNVEARIYCLSVSMLIFTLLLLSTSKAIFSLLQNIRIKAHYY